MKKLNKVAALFASAALAAPMVGLAQSNSADNWRAGDGTVWKNGSGDACWRDASWTPATANPACDGALKPPPRPRLQRRLLRRRRLRQRRLRQRLRLPRLLRRRRPARR